MRFADAYRDIAKRRGYSMPKLADALGVAYGSIASMLHKGNPTVDAMDKYLGRLGYSVAIVPAGSNLPDGSYVLEPSKESK